jgi:pimeloyl-ACP methyl ester carboxylesterase
VNVLLVHGGLHEDMDARRFWGSPGVVSGLEQRGLRVAAPDRLPGAISWQSEADHLAPVLPDEPAVVVAGSNGCSVAVRLALTHPGRIGRLILAWPATAGDRSIDDRVRERVTDQAIATRLLRGGTLRGVLDSELADLRVPTGVLPSARPSPAHQRRTVDALLRLLPDVRELPGAPEPVRPEFAHTATRSSPRSPRSPRPHRAEPRADRRPPQVPFKSVNVALRDLKSLNATFTAFGGGSRGPEEPVHGWV